MQNQTDSYLELHSQPNSIARQVAAFERYRSYVPEGATILDWGCKHAPDSILLRFDLGPELTLLGCDLSSPDEYSAFHEKADLAFARAVHPYLLPYNSDSIDVVVASGVLEHVAIPAASLTEIYRVLRVGGVLAVTFLPNQLAWTEFLLRAQGSNHHHRRRYSRRRLRRLLLDHGFEPTEVGFHQFVPAQRGGRLASVAWPMNSTLERVPPFKFFCSNLYAVSAKRAAI